MMQNQAPGMGAPAGVQSDAICAVCGSVNPEGVPQCLSCGNNLVEQHRQRLAQGGVQVFEEPGTNIRAVVSGAFAVLGLVVVLLVALNIGQIESMMVGAQSNTLATRLWDTPEGAVYSTLAGQLPTTAPTGEEVDAVLESPAPITALAGRYVLITGEVDPVRVGHALLQQEGNTVHFVARLNQGGEIRGRFTVPEGTLPGNATVRWDDAGLQYMGEVYSCAGAAILHENGVISCFGQTELDENDYTFSAYKLPG